MLLRLPVPSAQYRGLPVHRNGLGAVHSTEDFLYRGMACVQTVESDPSDQAGSRLCSSNKLPGDIGATL